MLGQWREGLAELDEASAAATWGRLDLRVASDIQCITIGACRNVGDLKRAAQWAEEGERWMRRQGVGGYPGICRVHQAELKMLHGRWAEAEQDARQACDELERYRLMDGVGFAQYFVGEVRLRMGDLDAAAEAFDRAYEHGHDPQPGFSLLLLARGDGAAARGRSDPGRWPRPRGRVRSPTEPPAAALLPAQVEIALAAGDLEVARRAVEELEAIASRLRAARLPGERADHARSTSPGGGQAVGGVADPRAVMAPVADDGSPRTRRLAPASDMRRRSRPRGTSRPRGATCWPPVPPSSAWAPPSSFNGWTRFWGPPPRCRRRSRQVRAPRRRSCSPTS